jgi:hypothetical protein
MLRAALAFVLLVYAAACGNTDCDKKLFAGTCLYPPDVGQCVDFSGLSTNDSRTANSGCVNRGGSWTGAPDGGGTPCVTAGEVGTCGIPPNAPNIDLQCSPSGVVKQHFYPPVTPQQAQQICGTVDGGTFTPGA